MGTTLDKIERFAKEYGMLSGEKTVVAGVSGGADSMCMLHVLMQLQKKYGYTLQVVHIHHGIRGKEADEDMEYVENYCREHKIIFHGFHFCVEQIAKEQHLSSEEAGRMVRYEAFHKVLAEAGGGKIAVAHNSDDNSETFLLNLFRGSGIKGLSGIQPVREEIIRPVLCLKRQEILAYLQENGIEYKTDATNEEDAYTRNKIRNKLLPYVREQINERASEHIFSAAQALTEIGTYMEKQAKLQYAQCVCCAEKGYTISIEQLQQADVVLQKMVLRMVIEQVAGRLKDITARHVELMLDILQGKTGREARIAYGIVCRKNYGNLEVFYYDNTKKMHKNTEYFEENLRIGSEVFADGEEIGYTIRENEKLVIAKSEINFQEIAEKMYTKWLDYGILEGTIQIRNRKDGDYIVINDQGGRKKLKDYFIDQKIPREERDKILLLARDSEVFWIIGYRISERCKVTKDTAQVLRLEYRNSKIEE